MRQFRHERDDQSTRGQTRQRPRNLWHAAFMRVAQCFASEPCSRIGGFWSRQSFGRYACYIYKPTARACAAKSWPASTLLANTAYSSLCLRRAS